MGGIKEKGRKTRCELKINRAQTLKRALCRFEEGKIDTPRNQNKTHKTNLRVGRSHLTIYDDALAAGSRFREEVREARKTHLSVCREV